MEASFGDNHAEIELKAAPVILFVDDVYWQAYQAKIRLEGKGGKFAT